MDALEVLGLGASLSLLAGWRLYACVLATGIAMRSGIIDLPQHLEGLRAFASPWVMGAAGLGFLAEFFTDKLAWIDSIWDAVHTVIRPLGGALLALAVVDAGDPVWQVVSFLVGGGAAMLSHGAKTGARALVNTSPEPFSNVALSAAEDVTAVGALWLVLENPMAALAVAAVVALLSLLLLYASWRLLRRLFGGRRA